MRNQPWTNCSEFWLFRHVVETGSFTAAAQAMQFSPAMMTKYIRQLETQLGTRLLTRSTRSIQLTEVGDTYYRGVVPLLRQMTALDEEVGAANQEPRGELRVTAPVMLGAHLLGDVISHYQSQYPNVRVSLNITARQVDLFREPYDLALRAGKLNTPDLIARKFAKLDLVLCASPAYLAARPTINHPSDLGGHDAIVNAAIPNGDTWQFKDGRKPMFINVNARFSSNSVSALKYAALNDQGLLYLPRTEVQDLLAAGKLEERLPRYILPPMEVYIVYADRRHLPAKIRCFIDMLVQGFES